MSETIPSVPMPGTVHLDNTLGALLVGGLLAATLYGITCTQTFVYLNSSSNKRRDFKLFVAGLWCLDTLDMCLTGHVLYWYLVTNYANFLALVKPTWSILLHVAITSISDFIVRSMFAWRVWRLSRGNYIVTGGIVAVSLIDLVCGITITVKAFNVASYLALSGMANLLYLNFAAGVTSDFMVAIALSWYLWHSRTGFERTDGLVSVLMMYTINTGLLTAFDACFGLIAYAVMPQNFIFIAAYLLLSKLYLNSYLYSLNIRDQLRESSDGIVSVHLSKLPTHISGTRDVASDGRISKLGFTRSSTSRLGFTGSSDALGMERSVSRGESDKISIHVERSIISH